MAEVLYFIGEKMEIWRETDRAEVTQVFCTFFPRLQQTTVCDVENSKTKLDWVSARNLKKKAAPLHGTMATPVWVVTLGNRRRKEGG